MWESKIERSAGQEAGPGAAWRRGPVRPGGRTCALLAALLVVASGLSPAAVLAQVDSPAPPEDAGSAMFTLGDVAGRLETGAAGVKRAGGFSEPSSGPGDVPGVTLDAVMNLCPAVDDVDGASASEVLSGQTFWGLRSGGGWGPLTGTLATQMLSPTTTAVSAGFYEGTDLVTVEGDLVSGNVRSGIEIFGVSGGSSVVDTSSGDALAGEIVTGRKAWVDGSELTGTLVLSDLAPVPASGQTTLFAIGDDGDLQRGVALPSPRFTDHGDGTVTDHLTGLVWLANAACAAATRNWATALGYVAQLNTDGTMNLNDCGDESNAGSHQTDWRLPNRRELSSLIHDGFVDPAISNAAGTATWTEGDPFVGVVSSRYWSSTTYAGNTTNAWFVNLNYGNAGFADKSTTLYVWAVRAGGASVNRR